MKKVIIFLSITCIFLLHSCETFLDEQYPPETPWQTVEQFEMAVANPYSTFFTNWTCPWGIYSFYDMVSTDMGSLIEGQTGNFPWNEFYNRLHRTTTLESTTAGWINDAYYSCYKTILASNDPLVFLESKEFPELFPRDSKTDIDANIPRAKAELLFWRGYAYYYLALFFLPPYNPQGDNSARIIPLKTSPMNPTNTKIGTIQEIWDQVISDLTAAKNLMPKDWHIDGRVDYYAICAALARAYLYIGNYSAAKQQYDEIINSNKYSLQSDVFAAWNSAPGDPVPSEVIWFANPNTQGAGILRNFTAISRAHYSGVNGARGDDYRQIAWVMSILSNYTLKRIGWMVDPENGDYTETDLARSDARYGPIWFRLEQYTPKTDLPGISEADYRNTYESTINTLTFPHVYLDKYFRGALGNFTRFPVMRVSESYLMRSMINLENGDATSAASDLNAVRRRAGLSDISAGEITIEAIEREIIIELGGEGLYLPYLISFKRPIPAGDRMNAQPVQPPYASWYWHIPVSEVNLNGGYEGFDPNEN